MPSRARNRNPVISNVRVEADRRFRAAAMSQGRQFRRGVEVAFKDNPKVKIGEVSTPPTTRNPITGVTLLSGDSTFRNHNELVVWQDSGAANQ